MRSAYSSSDELSPFAATIVGNKYAHTVGGNRKETWGEIAYRQATSVVKPYLPEYVEKVERFISQRKLMPGGRYLYAAGRRYPQVNNCMAGETRIITRNGVFNLRELVGQSIEVLNRYGRWEKATVKSFGVQRLYRMSLVNGDTVYATEGHRWCSVDGGYTTTLNTTRIPLTRMFETPNLDEEGIRHGVCYGDGCIQKGQKTDRLVLCTPEKRTLAAYFPELESHEVTTGLYISRIPKRYKTLPDVKTCTAEYARGFIAGLIATDGSTKTTQVTISCSGMEQAETIRELAILGGCVVAGISIQGRVGDVTNLSVRKQNLYVVRMKPFSVPTIRVDQIRELESRKMRPAKMWVDVTSIEDSGRVEEVYCCVVPGTESFTLSNGLASMNCFLYTAEDSREGWGELMNGCTQALMTGGGVGVVYSKLRAEGELIRGLGGKSTGPLALMQMVNEAGRHIMQGSSRRSALWSGLHWNHPDIFKFIGLKQWSEAIRRCKQEDFSFGAPMDGTNISVILDDEFFLAYEDETHTLHSHAHKVYWTTVRQMLETGEPGFSVDIGDNSGEHLRNAPVCGETRVFTSEGYKRVIDLVGVPTTVWTGKRWAKDVVFKMTGENVDTVTVRMSDGNYIRCDPTHPFLVEKRKGEQDPKYIKRIPAADLQVGDTLHVSPSEFNYNTPIPITVVSVGRSESDNVYCCDVGVEEHSFMAEGVIISNCTEVTSRDSGDMCNLASLNMARIDSPEEFFEVLEAATAFLICGSLYSKLPLDYMYKIREKNRRIGLGLMGVHEWLLKRGYQYKPNDELAKWMEIYLMSGAVANRIADKLSCSRPVATRSIAPTGTISIVAETTSGIEPVFAVSYKRRYLDGKQWKARYVIDATAKRLIESGVAPDLVEDAYTLAGEVERRINFQGWMQQYVDHGISSTINLPQWGSSLNNEGTVTRFGETLFQYLPKVRGITAYPDGSRGGQPLTRVSYQEALSLISRGEFIEERETGDESCKNGVCYS